MEPGLQRILDDDGVEVAAAASWLQLPLRAVMYREMLRVRLLDEAMLARQRQGKIGFYGTCLGQEAVPIAAAFATRRDDWVFPALRESSIMLVRGFPLAKYLAQVYGSVDDVLLGRQMPCHMSGRSVSQVSWSSCIGTQLCHAVGAAWAAQLRGVPCAVLAFLGDGATSSGDFYSAITFAAVKQTATVFICQNNGWALSTPTSRQSAAETLASKARANGIASARIDGNDVLVVAMAVRAACDRARSGRGPTFIECVNYRVGPHSSSDDPSLYRSDEEAARWRRADPLKRLAANLQSYGYWDEALQRQWEAEIRDEISRAIQAAEAHGPPPKESLFNDVYTNLPWHLSEQRRSVLFGPTASL